MTPAALNELLKRALLLDAQAVRLIPGRRTVVVVPAGESEVRGEPQTPERINALMDALLTPEARRSLGSGWAEWEFELDGKGPVRACAELKVGLINVSFYLDRCHPETATLNNAEPARPTGGQRKASPSRFGAAAPPPRRTRSSVAEAAPVRGAPERDGRELARQPSREFSVEPDEFSEADFGAIGETVPPPRRQSSDLPPALGGRPGVEAERAGAERAAPARRHSPAMEIEDLQPRPAPAAKRAASQPEPRREQPLATVPPAPAAEQAITGAGVGGGSTEAIDRLLTILVKSKSSDLHISTGAPPMTRCDGELKPLAGEAILTAETVHRIIWPVVPARNRAEFTETKDSDFAYEISGLARFRGNVFVDIHGMGAVFRIIPSKVLSVEDLNLPSSLLGLTQLPKGLVLVTGPTGSGKSTTLAALIDYANKTRHDHIITIEDPVEFVHKNIKCLVNQRQVGEHTKSFKAALRAALREDPDIVLLGEMRDLETISIALETAETGHLVFGTLHTSSAPSTIDRIIDQFPAEEQNQIRVMLANSLRGVVSQMLCKKIGGGRVAALEVMFVVPAISNLIREQKIFQIPSIIQTSRKLGMCLMNESLLEHIKAGFITPEEAWLKSNDKGVLKTMLNNNNIPLPPSAEGKDQK